jgi:hypothetical protein
VEANDEKFNNFVSHKNHIPTTYLLLTVPWQVQPFSVELFYFEDSMFPPKKNIPEINLLKSFQ